jgi:hypothetical protein
MFLYQWIVGALTVLTALVSSRLYQKSSPLLSPPFPRPPTSLQGMPPELRNNFYEFVAINTSMQAMRVVSGKKLVEAYDNPHAGHRVIKFLRTILILLFNLATIDTHTHERRTIPRKKLIAAYKNLHTKRHEIKVVRTNLKWYLGLLPMPDILVPVPEVDVASILPVATAPHPLSITSRQMRAEFQPFDKEARGGEYLFILNNFDMKQMGIIAASIHALDTEAHARDPPVTLQFHVCFTFDDNAVSSAEELCSWIEETNTAPLGLEYIAHKMTNIQVKNEVKEWQAERIYEMLWDLRCSRDEGEATILPIRFASFLFQNKVRVHLRRELGTWAPSEVDAWDAMARVSTG